MDRSSCACSIPAAETASRPKMKDGGQKTSILWCIGRAASLLANEGLHTKILPLALQYRSHHENVSFLELLSAELIIVGVDRLQQDVDIRSNDRKTASCQNHLERRLAVVEFALEKMDVKL